jgi:hypothetical protein
MVRECLIIKTLIMKDFYFLFLYKLLYMFVVLIRKKDFG